MARAGGNDAFFVSPDTSELREQLASLTDQALKALLTEPFTPSDAETIGTALAQVGATESETLGRTVEMLMERLAIDPLLADPAALQPRIAAVLGAITTGFLRQKRVHMLAEQEEIRRALHAARMNAESALRASEERYRAVVSQAIEGIVLVDPVRGCIRETNPAFQRLLGYSEEELIGFPLHEILADERARTSIDRSLRQAVRSGQYHVREGQFRRKDGTVVIVEGTSSTIVTAGGEMLCVVVRDVTERVQVEAELNEVRRGLAAGREAERMHLARELHDGAVQELAGLRYQLASVRHRLPASAPADAHMAVEAVEDQIGQVIGQLRELITELRPTGLTERGLAAALNNYIGRLPRTTGRFPIITVDVSPLAIALPPAVALCLFRVAQEALRNALVHGQPRHVTIRVRMRTRDAILRVTDDGQGFVVPARLNTLARLNHYGVVGMAERAAEVNGCLRIHSRPGKGTLITACVPRR